MTVRLGSWTIAAALVTAPAVAQQASTARQVAAWRASAERGDAEAQFRLGRAYKLGQGVTEDAAAAENWFRKGAGQGDARSEEELALVLFQAGRKADALPWLEKAAGRGQPRAQLVLGTMLFNGDVVPRDYPRAYALVSRASASGLKPAAATLAQMENYLLPADRARGLALSRELPGGTAPSPVVQTPAAAPPAVAAPAAVPAASVAAAATGRYRVQLGAFRNVANARALWDRVGGAVGGEVSYVEGGGVTRLRAGPFGSAAEANRACAAARQAGSDCAVVGG